MHQNNRKDDCSGLFLSITEKKKKRTPELDCFGVFCFIGVCMLVSFDFDDTLIIHDVDQDYSYPNMEMINKLKEYVKNGDKVVIVTTRFAEHKQEVVDFVKLYELPVDSIYCTDHSWKRNTLKRLGVEIHYDDNKDEIRRLKHTKVKGFLV